MNDKIKELATVGNAKIWIGRSDQYLFCLNLLGLTTNDKNSSRYVNELEDEFDSILNSF